MGSPFPTIFPGLTETFVHMDDGVNAQPNIRRWWQDPLSALWAAFSSPTAARVLTGALAFVLLLAQIIPQWSAAEGTAAGTGFDGWAAELSPFFQPHIGWMRALGLFTLGQSIGVRVLLALFAAALLVTLADGLWELWRFLRRGEGPARRRPEIAQQSLPAEDNPPAEMLPALRELLLGRRYLTRAEQGADETVLRAMRWPAGALAHLGGLVILLALALNASFGWQIHGLAVEPGQETPLGASAYSVSLEHGRRMGPHGAEAVEIITLSRAGAPEWRGVLSPGGSFRSGALHLTVLDSGPLVRAHAETAAGRPARLEAYPRAGTPSDSLPLAFAPYQKERYFRSLDTGNVFRLALDEDRGYTLEIYRAGETAPFVQRRWQDSLALDIGDERVFFSSDYYVTLSASFAPARPMLFGGALLAAAGLLLAPFCTPAYQVWRWRKARAKWVLEWEGPVSEADLPKALAEKVASGR